MGTRLVTVLAEWQRAVRMRGGSVGAPCVLALCGVVLRLLVGWRRQQQDGRRDGVGWRRWLVWSLPGLDHTINGLVGQPSCFSAQRQSPVTRQSRHLRDGEV
jgi:hypothetical protein